MKWQQINIVIKDIGLEAVTGILNQLGSSGVIIEKLQNRLKTEDNFTGVDSGSLDIDSTCVKAYFPKDRRINEELEWHLNRVQDVFNIKYRIYYNEVQDENWEQTWKEHYHMFKVGKRIVVKPAWQDYQAEAGEVIISINPGMAFGTGIHASTRFCLYFIDKYLKGNETVVDAGCGSGILSIAAGKLGASRVFAVDNDEIAVKVAKENIFLNNLQDKIMVEKNDIIRDIGNFEVDIILANITAQVLGEFIPQAAPVLPEGGYFFGSGIIETQWEEVKSRFIEYGFIIEEVLQDAEWIGAAARKNLICK